MESDHADQICAFTTTFTTAFTAALSSVITKMVQHPSREMTVKASAPPLSRSPSPERTSTPKPTPTPSTTALLPAVLAMAPATPGPNAFAKQATADARALDRYRLNSNAFYQETRRVATPPTAVHPALRDDTNIENGQDDYNLDKQASAYFDQGGKKFSDEDVSAFTEPQLVPPSSENAVPTRRGRIEERREQQLWEDTGGRDTDRTPVYQYTPKHPSRLERNVQFPSPGVQGVERLKSPKKGLLGRLHLPGFKSSTSSTHPPTPTGPFDTSSTGSDVAPKAAAILDITSPKRKSFGWSMSSRTPSKKDMSQNQDFSLAEASSSPKSTMRRNKSNSEKSSPMAIQSTSSQQSPRLRDGRVISQPIALGADKKVDATPLARSKSMHDHDANIPPTPPVKDTPPELRAMLPAENKPHFSPPYQPAGNVADETPSKRQIASDNEQCLTLDEDTPTKVKASPVDDQVLRQALIAANNVLIQQLEASPSQAHSDSGDAIAGVEKKQQPLTRCGFVSLGMVRVSRGRKVSMTRGDQYDNNDEYKKCRFLPNGMLPQTIYTPSKQESRNDYSPSVYSRDFSGLHTQSYQQLTAGERHKAGLESAGMPSFTNHRMSSTSHLTTSDRSSAGSIPMVFDPDYSTTKRQSHSAISAGGSASKRVTFASDPEETVTQGMFTGEEVTFTEAQNLNTLLISLPDNISGSDYQLRNSSYGRIHSAGASSIDTITARQFYNNTLASPSSGNMRNPPNRSHGVNQPDPDARNRHSSEYQSDSARPSPLRLGHLRQVNTLTDDAAVSRGQTTATIPHSITSSEHNHRNSNGEHAEHANTNNGFNTVPADTAAGAQNISPTYAHGGATAPVDFGRYVVGNGNNIIDYARMLQDVLVLKNQVDQNTANYINNRAQITQAMNQLQDELHGDMTSFRDEIMDVKQHLKVVAGEAKINNDKLEDVHTEVKQVVEEVKSLRGIFNKMSEDLMAKYRWVKDEVKALKGKRGSEPLIDLDSNVV